MLTAGANLGSAVGGGGGPQSSFRVHTLNLCGTELLPSMDQKRASQMQPSPLSDFPGGTHWTSHPESISGPPSAESRSGAGIQSEGNTLSFLWSSP